MICKILEMILCIILIMIIDSDNYILLVVKYGEILSYEIKNKGL